MKPIKYILRKKFSAYVIAISSIIGLVFVKKWLETESDIILGAIIGIQVVAGSFMAVQAYVDKKSYE